MNCRVGGGSRGISATAKAVANQVLRNKQMYDVEFIMFQTQYPLCGCFPGGG